MSDMNEDVKRLAIALAPFIFDAGKAGHSMVTMELDPVKFALNPRTEEGMAFLRCWMDANFDAIRKEWPKAPKAVFVGADPAVQKK